MTARRVCLLVAAIVGLSACSTAAAGGARPSPVTQSPTVELGPMPTRPTVATAVVPSTAGPVVARPASIPATTSPPATTTVTAATTTTMSATMTTAVSTPVSGDRPQTSCAHLAYVGDSVSLGVISAETLPNAVMRLDSRMAAIGVADLRVEVSGGRSIVETLPGQENAVDVAVRLRNDGFNGCWVVEIGTNDAANIAAGGARQADERITSLMSVIGADPVLWIDAATITDTGFWAAPNIEAWNAVLTAAAPSYPNLRIAHWSNFVRQEWFTSDGIHPNAAGTAALVQFVADGLVADFPRQ